MAISFVGGVTSSALGSSTTSLNVSLTGLTGGSGSAAQEGDIVIVVVATGATVDRDLSVTTSGYTELIDIVSIDAYYSNLSVWWKVMGATPDTTVTVAPSGSSFDGLAVAVHVWRGVDGASPFDVTGVTDTGIDTGQPNPPSITPSTSGAVILACGGAAMGGSISAFTSSDLSNFISIAQSETYDVAVGLGSYAWTSGAFDAAQFGGGTTNVAAAWTAYTMALKPATTSPSISPGSASLTITGSAPVPSMFVDPGAGSISVTGEAPTVNIGAGVTVVTPADAALAIAGAVPAVAINSDTQPGAATVTITAETPTVAATDNVTAEPGDGSITIATEQPSLPSGTIVSPGAGALSIDELAPNAVQNSITSPGAGSATLTGHAVTLQRLFSATPDPDALVITGEAPSLLESVATIAQPAAGSLAATGLEPTAVLGVVATPDAGAVAIAGAGPALLTYRVVSPGSASMEITGQVPTTSFGAIAYPASGVLSLSGSDPIPLASVTIGVPAAEVAVSASAPVIEEQHLPSPAPASGVISPHAPGASIGYPAAPAAATLTVAGEVPGVAVGTVLRVIGYPPSISAAAAYELVASATVRPAVGVGAVGCAPAVADGEPNVRPAVRAWTTRGRKQ